VKVAPPGRFASRTTDKSQHKKYQNYFSYTIAHIAVLDLPELFLFNSSLRSRDRIYMARINFAYYIPIIEDKSSLYIEN
jgi:hypothetical protein